MGFDKKFKINLYHDIFLRLRKYIPVFLSLLSFSAFPRGYMRLSLLLLSMKSLSSNMCVSLVFRKAKAFQLNYLCELFFKIAVWTVCIYQKHLIIGAVNFFWNFQRTSRKKPMVRSCCSQVFKCPQDPQNSQENASSVKGTPVEMFSCESYKIFIDTFTERFRCSWGLSLKKLYIVDVHRKFFDQRVANEFSWGDREQFLLLDII